MHSRLIPCLLAPCLIAAGAILAGTAVSSARAQDAPTAACKALSATYDAAVASGDPAQLAAQYTTDGVLSAPEGVFQGSQAITAYARLFIQPGAREEETLKAARQVGAVVLCAGDYTFIFAPGGPMKEMSGHFGSVLTKSGDAWRIEQLAYSHAPPPAQPQSQAQAR